jgi:hypothetical protein
MGMTGFDGWIPAPYACQVRRNLVKLPVPFDVQTQSQSLLHTLRRVDLRSLNFKRRLAA